jgi:hypothetical protein
METQEQIDSALEAAGHNITILKNNEIIKAIPGFEIITLPDQSSPYDIKKQEFTFEISTISFTTNNLAALDRFTFSTFSRLYTFRIASFMDYTSGWVQLQCELVGVQSV